MRLPELPRPERYELDLWVDPARKAFRGEVEISLEVEAGTRSIELHAVDLELGAASARDSEGELRVGYAVGKRLFPKSTDRNRVRRRLRAPR